MISKETAQQSIKKFYNPRSAEDQLARLKKLPTELSTLGQILIRTGPAWEKLQQTVNRGGETRYLSLMQLGKLSASDRQRLFSALFPGIAPYVEATWNLFNRLPYQTSHSRRPFRNPYQPTDEARINWLIRLPFAVQGYEAQNISWLAAWVPHLGVWGPDVLGYLFAAAMDGGEKTGDEIFEILIASARGTHETGAMGRHVVRGLLCSTRPEGWAFLEGLLLAAQREEGLRQVLLEAIDEAHPQAFRRMLRMVVEHHLTRFSALIRAFGVWFGLPLEAVSPKEVSHILSQILTYLEDPSECEKAVQHTDPQQAYFAWWAMAFDNVHLAIPSARNLAHVPEVEKRYAAVHFLAQVNLPETYPDLLHALKDEDLRIPARVVTTLNVWEHQALFQSGDLFESLESVLARLKHKQQTFEPLVWNWTPLVIERQMVADKLLDALGSHSPKRLFPYLPLMGPRSRERVVRLLKSMEEKDGECIQALLTLSGDASQSVRELALEGIQGVILTEGEVVRLEGLLSRQATDLHRGIIQFLLALPDERLFDSLQRLFAHKQEKVRLSALELLKEARHQRRAPDQIQALARAYQQRPTLSEFETRLLNETLVDVLEQPSLDNALGLMNPQNQSPATPVKPRNPKIKFISPAALACLKALDAWIEQHRIETLEIPHGDQKTTELLGNIRYAWMLYPGKPEPLHKYPHFLLKEFVERWEQATAKDRRDKDGLVWMRALAAAWLFEDIPVYMFQAETKGPTQDIQQHYGISVDFTLNYPGLIWAMMEWLVWAHPVAEEVDYLLDALETSVARIPQPELIKMEMGYSGHLVRHPPEKKLIFLQLARWHRNLRPEQWQPEHHTRLWQVVRWLDEPEAGLLKIHERLEDALWAFQAGAATRDDLFNRFLGARPENPYTFGNGFSDLRMFSPRRLAPREQALVEKFPVLREIVDACRERILDVECQRGELPTAATIPAGSIRSVPGMSNLFRLLKAFGNADFERGHAFWVNQDRARVFSHLIRSSYPLEGDTLEAFARLVTQHQIPEKTLLTLAVFAPQWVSFVQATLAWAHLSEAVWWLYAHTKDRHWAIDKETRAEWVARISEYTPLTADDLMDGAVDVAWFKQMYGGIGEARWGKLYEIAIYASDGMGHTRARLFADAMLGKLSLEKEMERIRKKRHQDSV